MDKSDKQSTIYDSYNVELASTYIQSIEIEKVSNTYSSANELNHDINDKTNKYLLYTQFVAWYCDGCSVAPLTDDANNEIYQELTTMDKYFTGSDKRMYLEIGASESYTGELEKLKCGDSDLMLKRTLKRPTTKK